MADRTSAYIFSRVFDLIDEHVPEPKRREVALEFWRESQNYDFSNSQMECDDVLIRLGLARKGIDPRWPNDGEVTIYCGDREW